MTTIKDALAKLIESESLSVSEAETAMGEIIAGAATPAQVAAFLTALRMKGETVDELTGCALALRRGVTPVRPKRRDLVDICGIGRNRPRTFNISTLASLVTAGAGLAVAKHGNRSAHGRCGSADLLEAMGVNLELTPQQMADCIDQVGIGFLFAPRLQAGLENALQPAVEIGFHVILDVLEPLVNPASAEAQFVGVYAGGLTEQLAYTMRNLGVRSAYVVYGVDGLDELSTTGVNKVSRLDPEGIVATFALDAAELGLPRASLTDLAGGSREENVAITRAVLAGQKGPQRDIVVLNASAALVVGGRARHLREGVKMAEESLDSGAAARKLEELIEFTRSVGQ
ncbi:MAG: anthranilate phosphoribosyltransferase [Chloroflexi bacterium]|nr:anthranilate phosphoribosyltransferase [Chloroflexota bacterium]